MGNIRLDAVLRAQLGGLTEPVQVRDEMDQLVGVFLPMAHYQMLLRKVRIPFAPDEIERRMQEKGGCSLAEIWMKLGAK
jgi:hypothetical protein